MGVSDGYDSQSKSRKVQRGVRGLMNEIYLDDLKDKTHRGLAGQALKKFWAGGKPYGYRLVQLKDDARLDAYGNPEVIGTQLAIYEDQAAIVRDLLAVRQRLESAGDRRNAKRARHTLPWFVVARPNHAPCRWLAGQHHPCPRGERALPWAPAFKRTEWRKDPDTGKRKTRARPRSEWISHEMPELRIVDEVLWDRVIARRQRAAVRGAGVRAALQRAGHTGRGGPKYAFSGLLRCGVCGSSMVVVGGTNAFRAYGCSGNKDGGNAVCANGIQVRQTIVEARLLKPIKSELLTDEKLEAFGAGSLRR